MDIKQRLAELEAARQQQIAAMQAAQTAALRLEGAIAILKEMQAEETQVGALPAETSQQKGEVVS